MTEWVIIASLCVWKYLEKRRFSYLRTQTCRQPILHGRNACADQPCIWKSILDVHAFSLLPQVSMVAQYITFLYFVAPFEIYSKNEKGRNFRIDFYVTFHRRMRYVRAISIAWLFVCVNSWFSDFLNISKCKEMRFMNLARRSYANSLGHINKLWTDDSTLKVRKYISNR